MKKIALSLAVLFSVALVSCGNKEAAATDTESVAGDTAVVEEVAVSADSNETVVAAEVAEAPVEAPVAE